MSVPSTSAGKEAHNISMGEEQQQVQSTGDLHISDDEAPPPKTTRIEDVAKNKAPRKRKLRPEDERTLQILSEKFISEQNGAVCRIPSCKSKPMKCSKPANLKRHLYQLHPQVFADLFPHEVSAKKKADLEAFNAMQDAIELVTVNGYPFSMLNASGMRGFIKSRIESVRSGGHFLAINRLDIVQKVAEESKRVQNYIAADMHGKSISIMFDVCTVATLSVLGINASYMKGTDVVCRSLGIIKIEKRHSSVALADMVFDILAQYGVSLKNVFSITTDTAKNATATSDILNLVLNNHEQENLSEQNIFDFEHDDDGLDFGIDVENEVELQNIIDNEAMQTQLIRDVAENIAREHGSIEMINQINCGTHVLQLSVNDALAEANSQRTIQSVHDMCVLMRTQIVMIEIRKTGTKIILPPLDNITRWNSKYMMVIIFAQQN